MKVHSKGNRRAAEHRPLEGIMKEFSVRESAKRESGGLPDNESAGIIVLFAGPSGTGKSLAAEVIAREINRDLLRVDLRTMVGQYIGDTEKNLDRLLTEASGTNAVLLLEEADALFGKRGEVKDSHDRFANADVSHLWQRIERYEGIAILATNHRSNVDAAFLRRLRFVVDFPLPGIASARSERVG